MVKYTEIPILKRKISSTLSLFALAFILLAAPSIAIPHFDNEYITPKYGASLYGQYYYKDITSTVEWYWATPSFENNGGYYNIFDYGETVTFEITINTSLTGDLYLWIAHQNQEGEYEFSYYLVKASSSYNNLRVSKEVQLPNTWHGATYYYWTLYSGGNYYYSNIYHFFIKGSILEDWQYKRSLTITTTKAMKNGTFEFEINDTDFYSNSKTFYVSDDCEYCLSGTTTDIVITNTDLTKAYPYFINKYKGGYYEYNQNTSNSTLIDVWVNEDTTAKNFFVYYGFERLPDDATASLFGMNSGHILDWQSDEPNNPFTVHQIFADWRWTEDQAKDLFNISGSRSYSRGTKVNAFIQNSFFRNNLTHFVYEMRRQHASFNIWLYQNEDGSSIIVNYPPTYAYKIRLYNQTNYTEYSTGGSSSGWAITIFDLYIDSDNLTLDFDVISSYNSLTDGSMEIPYNLDYFKIEKIYCQGYGNPPSYWDMHWYKELPDITDYYNLGNQSLNDYAIVNFESMYEYSTFINDLWIGGIISTDTSGTIICYDMDGNALGSIKTPETSTAQSYEITFPYRLSNKTDFLSRSDFNYTCKFVTDTGYEVYSDNYTITFDDSRVYISEITPSTQHIFNTEYIATSIDLELNYTGINTNIDLIINSITCNSEYNDKCLEYDINYLADSYSEENINSPYSYDGVFKLTKNKWYQYYYRINKSNNISSTPPRLFYISYEEELFQPPPETYIDWNDTNLTENDQYMEQRFWSNPLSYLSSMLYQNFIVPNVEDPIARNVFLWTFTIFWNFYTVLIVIGISIYQITPNIILSIVGTIPPLLFFSYLGWIGVPATTIYLLIALIVTVKIWKG